MTSVAVVVLDTLRKDAFDEHFDWLPGVSFSNAWSPSSWTVPVHGSLFCGRYPGELGIYANAETLDYDGRVLPERFADAGYRTRAFSANAYVSPAFDYDRGFETFETSWRGARRDPDVVDWADIISETQGQGPSRYLRALHHVLTSDKDTLRSLKFGLRIKAKDLGIERLAGADSGAAQVRENLRATDFGDAEFYFCNLMEAHSPYDPPADYRTVDLTDYPHLEYTLSADEPPIDPATIRQAYDDSVRYLADIYEDIFAELAASFDYVVTLGDHGELFGEGGAWAHCHGVHPALVHVPLSIYRSREESTTVDTMVSLLDVHRTVLELADLDAPESRGQHLLDDPQSREALVERYGFTDTKLKKLRTAGFSEGRIADFDVSLRGLVAPEAFYGWQSVDGFRDNGAEGPDDPEARLDALVSDLDLVTPDERPETETAVDDAVMDRLEDLGYA